MLGLGLLLLLVSATVRSEVDGEGKEEGKGRYTAAGHFVDIHFVGNPRRVGSPPVTAACLHLAALARNMHLPALHVVADYTPYWNGGKIN